MHCLLTRTWPLKDRHSAGQEKQEDTYFANVGVVQGCIHFVQNEEWSRPKTRKKDESQLSIGFTNDWEDRISHILINKTDALGAFIQVTDELAVCYHI